MPESSKDFDVLINNLNDYVTSTKTWILSASRRTDFLYETTSSHVPIANQLTHIYWSSQLALFLS